MKLTKKQIERYSRQIILKKVGVNGQKKISGAKVLIVGAGGLGSPIAMYLAAIGIGKLAIIDNDKVEISNLSRQIIFSENDIGKYKSSIAVNKLKKVNRDVNFKSFNKKLTKKNINKIAKNYDLIIDGSDNFETRFLINDYCLKNKKILVSGAISKFDGQVYTFNFLHKESPCLRCFIPEMPIDSDSNNCEYEGVIGTLAGIIGSIMANEAIKEILKIGDTLFGYVLIIDSLTVNYRKVRLNKRSDCLCHEK